MVNAAFAADEIVKGYVKTRTKGGMIVDVFGIEAFLPGSQIDIKPIRDYDQYVDTNMDFKIVKINQEFRNVVVSHKALIEAELEQQKSEIIGKLEKGQVLEGTVKNITGYGVFVDLGGVDGLIHITDLSWGRINHPEEVVALDQSLVRYNYVAELLVDLHDLEVHSCVNILIVIADRLDVEAELEQQKSEIIGKLEKGQVLEGTVKNITGYGVFVDLGGVDGLIHITDLSWGRINHPEEVVALDQKINVVILDFDDEKKRIALGLKQLTPHQCLKI